MKDRITTFIFDCFGVICASVVTQWYQENRTKKGYVDENFLSILHELDLGNFSEDDLLEYFLKYEGVTITKAELRKEIDSYLSLDESLAMIIKDLRSKGYMICLLSNANNEFFERMIYPTYPEFKALFDEILISANIGMVKPDEEMYRHALKVMNANPEEAVFIDDSLGNVEAANKLGIKGFVYTDSQSFAHYLKKEFNIE